MGFLTASGTLRHHPAIGCGTTVLVLIVHKTQNLKRKIKSEQTWLQSAKAVKEIAQKEKLHLCEVAIFQLPPHTLNIRS